jgi:MFS family permease
MQPNLPSLTPSNGLSNSAADRSPQAANLAVDPALARPSFAALATLFGLFYFLQGIGEPSDGLLTQPVRSLLIRWGQNGEQITRFSTIITLPWSIKPIYGLISDFVPLFGYRRKSYLMLASALSAGALFTLSAIPVTSADTNLLLCLLLIPAVGIAFSDVVIDALMIERGQPFGWTGQLQAVQWTGLYSAMAITGILGGYLSQHLVEHWGFFICGCSCVAAFALSYSAPEQRRRSSDERGRLNLRPLGRALRIRVLWAAAVFLFLWNFNPFSASILQIHLIRHIGFSNQFFGNLKTITAVGAIVGALSYGLMRRYISFRLLLHGAIVLGIVSTAAYWGLEREFSAQVVSAGVGFTTAVATLIQLDLAAQVCPVEIAGTVFAVLMSLSNFSTSLSEWAGGIWYDRLSESLGSPHAAFQWLVGIGSLTTAACWLVMPWLLRGLAATPTAAIEPPTEK